MTEINRYYIPLYMPMDRAKELLAKKGVDTEMMRDYKNKPPLVRTYVVDMDGKILDMWAPMHDPTPVLKPGQLAERLRAMATRLGLGESAPVIPEEKHARASKVQVVVRYPTVKSHRYTLDRWIMSESQWAAIAPRPDTAPGSTYTVPFDTAASIIVHLRPATDAQEDFEPQALPKVKLAHLEATLQPRDPSSNEDVVVLRGRLEMSEDLDPRKLERASDDGWTQLLQVKADVIGYARFDRASRQATDLVLATQNAVLKPIVGDWVPYVAVGSPQLVPSGPMAAK